MTYDELALQPNALLARSSVLRPPHLPSFLYPPAMHPRLVGVCCATTDPPEYHYSAQITQA